VLPRLRGVIVYNLVIGNSRHCSDRKIEKELGLCAGMRTFNLNIKFITHFLLILDDEYNDWQSSTGRSHHFNKLMISSQRLLTNLQMINI
jgi:hypothetical protein